MGEQYEKRIMDVANFVLEREKEGKTVYILDAEAVLYMIPTNKYNKDYDMFLIGNIGKDGQEGQIERIKQNTDNVIYLIRDRNIGQNWQTPMSVINYIRDNLDPIGQIGKFEIYR